MVTGAWIRLGACPKRAVALEMQATTESEALLEQEGPEAEARGGRRRLQAGLRGALALAALAALAGLLAAATGGWQAPPGFASPPGAVELAAAAGPHLCGAAMCADAEACLKTVDAFLDAQPRHFGLLQVRALGNLGGGGCGALCELPMECPEGPAKCRHDTYDNALAAIYYAKRGRLGQAKRILDAMLRILYPESLEGLRPSTSETLYRGVATGRTLTLLASSYNSANEPVAGNYETPYVTDGGVDSGNNAWAALAFVHYAAASGEPCYATVARDIMHALRTSGGACEDRLQGFLGHLPPYRANYRSAEHNIDIFALARALGSAEDERRASLFVREMFGRNRAYNHTYSTGTGSAHHCDWSQPPGQAVAADATFWNLLADADANKSRLTSALRFALESPGVDENGHPNTRGLWVRDEDRICTGAPVPKLSGVRFTTWGNGVQWENTASAVMAMVHFRERYGEGAGVADLPRFVGEARDSLRKLLGVYGGVPSSVLGGNYAAWKVGERDTPYPGGSDTGIGWPYLRYLSTAPTAWAGLMLLHQADEGQPVNADANPYAPPARPVPEGRDCSCLPTGALGADRAGEH